MSEQPEGVFFKRVQQRPSMVKVDDLWVHQGSAEPGAINWERRVVMNVSMLPPEKTYSAEEKDFILMDAAHMVPDVSDEALEMWGSESSMKATQLTDSHKVCCR